MRPTLPLLLIFSLATTAPAARAERAGSFVAQLAPAPGAVPGSPVAAGTRRAAGADGAAIAAAAPRLAALGVTLRRALLASLPAPGKLARSGPSVPGFAPERVVLLEAADSTSAEVAMRALADAGAVEWVEPLRQRSLALESYSSAVAAAPLTGAALDSLPNDSLLRAGWQWGLWNPGSAGGGLYGGLARAEDRKSVV